ncbi:hypothetical protein OIV83_003995 [Microbotryomycetes sp. JL201]|nr:hypothetical protein OIV83_003995 [Microbotryomycetes sp. JL201]
MSASGKEVLRQVHAHFLQSTGKQPSKAQQQPSPDEHVNTSTPAASTASAFPNFALPEPLVQMIESYLSSFASNYAGADEAGPASSTVYERDRERTRWRDSLADLWAAIEPRPGLEGDAAAIARVSAFVSLLDRLSATLKDDDDSAVVTREDVGNIWWDLVLKRVLLGTAKDDSTGTDDRSERRGRRRDAKTAHQKHSAATSTLDPSQKKPLTVSREALAATMRIVTWGMSQTLKQAERGPYELPAFNDVVKSEFEKRGIARMRGGDEWYGLRNISECVAMWAENCMQAYFERCAPFIDPSNPARMPFLSLLLNVLARHSGKAYHVLQTPLLSNLINFCLTTPSPASIALGIKCLQIFLVALPVIIGDHLFGIMAVYARAVSWDMPGVEESIEPTDKINDEAFDGPPPNPLDLFTILYGIYPCNFIAFVKDANAYLRSKEWKAPAGSSLTTGVVRERSNPLIRRHALHPALLVGDVNSELTDTTRWRKLETADVMAECHRNLIQELVIDDDDDDFQDLDDVDPNGLAQEGELFLAAGRSRARQRRTPFAQDLHDLLRLSTSRKSSAHSRPRDTSARQTEPQIPTARNASIAAASRSRSPTPALPTNTHFTNFQAFHSANSPSQSPGRSVSRLRQSDFDPIAFQGSLASAESSAPTSRAHSRASSIINSPMSPLGTHSATMPSSGAEPTLSRSNSKATQATSATSGAASGTTVSNVAGGPSSSLLLQGLHGSIVGVTASQIHKLETEIILLQGEVAFQTYLKQLHIAHMGTLHREKVLESGAEAERQVLYRTIRTLRAQLKQTKASLDQIRSETGATKANWTAHIDDLKERLKNLRDTRIKWEQERKELNTLVDEAREREKKACKDLEEQGAAFFDLQNQVQMDKEKLDKIADYEARLVFSCIWGCYDDRSTYENAGNLVRCILMLCQHLPDDGFDALSDEDLVNFAEQRRQMDQLAREWKKSELLRETAEAKLLEYEQKIRALESKLDQSNRAATEAVVHVNGEVAGSSPINPDWTKLQAEVERLRQQNADLKDRLLELDPFQE